jgi:transcriptional regulator with PAS, ATPase and Fis domain
MVEQFFLDEIAELDLNLQSKLLRVFKKGSTPGRTTKQSLMPG